MVSLSDFQPGRGHHHYEACGPTKAPTSSDVCAANEARGATTSDMNGGTKANLGHMRVKKVRVTEESAETLDAWLDQEGVSLSALVEAATVGASRVRRKDGTFPVGDPWSARGRTMALAKEITVKRRSRRPTP